VNTIPRRQLWQNYEKHGMERTPEYKSWQHMLDRCHNSANKRFADYGGRGIIVCERWRHSFINFYKDMGPKPSRGHSIDRVDNDGPYSPNNCRWATNDGQARNTRRNRWLTYQGETLCAADWARRMKMPHPTLHARLKAGWSVERALTQPLRKGGR
jgi:hypothetical protein